MFDTNFDNNEDRGDNVVDLKLITGGGTPPNEGDWLSELDKGSMFLVRHKTNRQDFNLGLFFLVEKTEKSVVLRSPSLPQNIYVIPSVFCNQYVLYEDLGILEVKEGDNSIDSDRISGNREVPNE